MNGANEEAVGLFLRQEIGFNDIARRVEDALCRVEVKYTPSLEDILEAGQIGPCRCTEPVGGTMIYIIAAILIFGVLIAVHELGHFLAAKACGVRVNEFSIGMGPTILDKSKGDTTYSLRLLPIGGFCAMEGERRTPTTHGPE